MCLEMHKGKCLEGVASPKSLQSLLKEQIVTAKPVQSVISRIMFQDAYLHSFLAGFGIFCLYASCERTVGPFVTLGLLAREDYRNAEWKGCRMLIIC